MPTQGMSLFCLFIEYIKMYLLLSVVTCCALGKESADFLLIRPVPLRAVVEVVEQAVAAYVCTHSLSSRNLRSGTGYPKRPTSDVRPQNFHRALS